MSGILLLTWVAANEALLDIVSSAHIGRSLILKSILKYVLELDEVTPLGSVYIFGPFD